jgi:hypothetical protein
MRYKDPPTQGKRIFSDRIGEFWYIFHQQLTDRAAKIKN